ncbi:hypothetical protein VTN49DRAFT_550 [Thermomyces lanuginosus]|uniref:uncharacterized protein n=1 Tax=Thermomyces lanuginosus TaxID=5541 RepID=UPI0037440751
MGACLSCLGLNSRDNHDSESARLLDDDMYAGYGYGSVNHSNHPRDDPEDVKREREALETICQRASDSVIDIWALQPQPQLQPQAALRQNGSTTSLRVPSDVTAVASTTDGTITPADSRPTSSNAAGPKKLATIPKHWGEVVISPQRAGKGKKAEDNDNDFFGVLRVT